MLFLPATSNRYFTVDEVNLVYELFNCKEDERTYVKLFLCSCETVFSLDLLKLENQTLDTHRSA